MNRVRAADDFKTIRLRLEELRRERAQRYADGPIPRLPSPEPETIARRSAAAERRIPLVLRKAAPNSVLERAAATRKKWNSALNFSDIFARVVALTGGTALLMRRLLEGSHEPAWGSSPAIPAAKPQGSIPTLKMPTAKGWTEGQTPVAAPGLTVNAFAAGLDHPRWIQVLPNGDVLVAEAMNMPRAVMRNLFEYAMVSTMRRAAAVGVSANRISEWRCWAILSMSATPMA